MQYIMRFYRDGESTPMSDVFETCIRETEQGYNWNEWRLINDPPLLYEECDRIAQDISSEFNDESRTAIVILCRSGLPLLPVALSLELPFCFYKRRLYVVGGSTGTSALLPHLCEADLEGKDFFAIDSMVCRGRVISSAVKHLKRCGARYQKTFVLMSTDKVKLIKGLSYYWRKRKIAAMHSISSNEEKILGILGDEYKGLMREFSFWNIGSENYYYARDIEEANYPPEYESLTKECGNGDILAQLRDVIIWEGYINVERIFLYPRLIKEIAQCIVDGIEEFDYDIICGISDVAMPLAFAIGKIVCEEKPHSNFSFAYIGRTLTLSGSLVWPDILDVAGKKVLLVSNKIMTGDAAAYSCSYLIHEQCAYHCDLAAVVQYGDEDFRKYFGFLHQEEIRLYCVYRYS